ncbi:alpha/beta fold hydrolase [Paenibacillus sp. LjRoot153]|uniref:alpha/beta fold hydrolase n=1 Tax=Paenibacillus sp. LjRoot153 TaxID=3342270 RepID=UPI003ECF31D3
MTYLNENYQNPGPSWPIPYPANPMPTNWPYMPPPWIQEENANYRAKEQPLTFVLVHGSWADASFWAGIASELSKKGHTVFVPEFPGHGADPNKNVTHAMISKSVADFIISHKLHNVVLVGHSFGGSVIQKVAELVPDRLKRIVFLNAFVLKDGGMLADELPPQVVEQFKKLIASSKNNTITLPFDFFRDAFTNLASLSQAQQIYKKAFPEPAGPLFEKLDLKKFYSLPIPKSYVHLMEDNVIPLGDPNYGWHPHMSSRLGLFRFIQLHGDHMTTAFYEPKLVAGKLYEAARD